MSVISVGVMFVMNDSFRRGCRLEANKVKVCVGGNGQFHTTIPKSIVRAAGLVEGSVLYFEWGRVNGILVSWKNPCEREFHGCL